MDPFEAPTEFEQDIENSDMNLNGESQEDSVLTSSLKYLTECGTEQILSQKKMTDSRSYHSLPDLEQVRSSENNVEHQFDIETDDIIQAKTIYDNIIQSSECDSKTKITFEEFYECTITTAWSQADLPLELELKERMEPRKRESFVQDSLFAFKPDACGDVTDSATIKTGGRHHFNFNERTGLSILLTIFHVRNNTRVCQTIRFWQVCCFLRYFRSFCV